MTLGDVLRRLLHPGPARLDPVLALPAAAALLEAATGMYPTGEAALCLDPGTGPAAALADDALRRLLERRDPADGPRVIRREWDGDGRHWIVLVDSRLDGLATAAHMAAAVLREHGSGTELRASVFGFTSAAQGCHLVYVHGRAAFYPFAPRPGRVRDAELEDRVRAALAGALPLMAEHGAPEPLWGVPLA